MQRSWRHRILALLPRRRLELGSLIAWLLVATALVLATYKVKVLGFSVDELMPRTQYRVTYRMAMDGHGGEVRVRSFLPLSNAHQTIFEEDGNAPGFHLSTEAVDQNRVATWTGTDVSDGSRIEHTFSVLAAPVRFDISPGLEVPASYPSSVRAWLQPEEAIQVDAPEIRDALARMGADRGPIVARLHAIFDAVHALTYRPFKGMTDALTALRLGEASCNGRSRLFVALARAAGLPARLVGGLVLEPGDKRTTHQWVEVWIAGHWVPFCPTNGHFASLPERYLVLYYGDQSLLRHTSDINFDYEFSTRTALVPSPAAKAWLPRINVWALFERLGLSFGLLRTVLMLPIGALVVVLFRNVVGMPTFGTFLPALIAAAAAETGAFWGVLGILLVVGIVGSFRWVLHRLELLHSPMLAILLAGVTTTMLSVSLVAEHFELGRLMYIALFPIAVLAITAERFYLSLTERGPTTAMKELGGTLAVMSACYVVMSSVALQVAIIGFPEVLLVVVAADIYLGRWIGMRVIEYFRFRDVLRSEARA